MKTAGPKQAISFGLSKVSHSSTEKCLIPTLKSVSPFSLFLSSTAMGTAGPEPAKVGRLDRDAAGLPGAAPVPTADREQKVSRH